MPDPCLAESGSFEGPLAAAVRTAERCRTCSPETLKKQWGQYFTGAPIAAYMAKMIEPLRAQRNVRILDPGAGTGILGIALAEQLIAQRKVVHLVAVEAEPTAAKHLEEALALTRNHLGKNFSFEVLRTDFLDLEAPALGTTPIALFDVAIGNPPYFKVSPTEARGGDAPNIYARFMEVAGRLLVKGGQLCFIVPRSFASGFYFQRFRRRFHAFMRLEQIHVFESRRSAFKGDDVLQENVIVHYRRDTSGEGHILISSSTGEHDLENREEHSVSRDRVLLSSARDTVLFLPLRATDLRILDLFRSFSHTIAHYGLEVSTGPVVPFRAEHELVKEPRSVPTVPMLWLQHVHGTGVKWPLGANFRKAEYIRASAQTKLLVANATYVLVRRFSSKEEARRLVAAVLRKGELPGEKIGLENHLNFIYRPGGDLSNDEADALAILLNSALFDAYFRISSGNTQVSATELRALPLPAPSMLQRIAKIISGAGDVTTEQIVEYALRAN
jgi:adenine-specific DNA-methyltransferase